MYFIFIDLLPECPEFATKMNFWNTHTFRVITTLIRLWNQKVICSYRLQLHNFFMNMDSSVLPQKNLYSIYIVSGEWDQKDCSWLFGSIRINHSEVTWKNSYSKQFEKLLEKCHWWSPCLINWVVEHILKNFRESGSLLRATVFQNNFEWLLPEFSRDCWFCWFLKFSLFQEI